MSTLDELLAQAKNLKMTDEQKIEQRLDFAYGNLAASTNHKPMRNTFRQLALKLGMTLADFDEWAAGLEWGAGESK